MIVWSANKPEEGAVLSSEVCRRGRLNESEARKLAHELKLYLCDVNRSREMREDKPKYSFTGI